jgi:competence protein ComEC
VIAPLEEDSYGHYLRSQGVECTMESFKVLSVSPGSLWNPLRMLEGIREKTERTITQVFPEPDASLVMGLLTGSRGMIPSTLQTDFKTSGLTHILAISGYNITMILLLLSSAFCWLPLKARIIPCALILIGFTFFTGASASVVRACIMGLLGLLALGTGREQMMRLSILWTLVLMTLWNPLQLWWDSGFHLSFLALGGLVEFSEKIAPWSQKVLPSTMGIEESIRGTLAAQVLTSPWILLAFERLSIIAPLSNLVVLPAVPFAMATGSIATLLGIIWLPLGSLAALAALPFTRWITGMTELLARIPGASIEGQPGTLWIAVSYGLIALWWYRGLPAVEK